MTSSAIVEADDKGRILLPIQMRRKYKSRRFKIAAKNDHLELTPLPPSQELRGKYKNIIKTDWEELEEKAEEFVRKNRR